MQSPPKFREKGMKRNYMVVITKEEAMAIRAKFGNEASITITNRHKRGGRKHYYLPEEGKFMYFLEKLRSKGLNRGKRGGAQRGSKRG